MTDELRTPAIEALEAAGIPFTVMRTEIARSAEESAAFQGIPVGSLLRSILVRRAQDDFLFVLVPGGRRFNWPKLRQLLGTNRLTLPTEEEAKAETGYVRGAITPFGARRPWPVIADASIEALDLVAIGGGARGVNVHLAPADLIRATDAQVVDITVPDALPPVLVDAPALRSCLANLIANAIKYGGTNRWVGVTASTAPGRKGPEVRIAVTDKGLGISSADLPHIFEPFYRGAEALSRQIQGNGLGLSIVKGIVDAHGGSVTAHSAQGEGSTFVLHLPAHQGDPSPVAQGTRHPSPQHS